MRIVISGATGLIGTALAASLDRDGIEVTRLVRRSPASPAEVSWDPRATAGRLDPAVLSGADGVVHLSGAPVAGGRWTPARKQQLRDSRIASTRAIVEAIAAAPDPPPALLCASAIGFYGDTGNKDLALKDDSGATKGKVKSLTVSGVHNCCGRCTTTIKATLAKVNGVTGDTVMPRKPTFDVTGDFDAVELVKALNGAGFHVKVKQ